MTKTTAIFDGENAELVQALRLIEHTRRSLFLTGKAGTGKSTFLRYVASHVKKKLVILAPTGIAAINVGGSTLHSFFKLPFHPLLPNDIKYDARHIRETLKYPGEKRKLLQELELIIIDEVSMVRADIIDFIDKVLRIYNQNLREPFGGKQLLLVGDIFQLEPVVKEDDRRLLQPYYPSPFFFQAHVFREMALVSIELQKIYRQQDRAFIGMLDHIRTSTVFEKELSELNKRVGQKLLPRGDELSITLSARRDTVEHINEHALAQLPGSAITFRGTIEGDFPVTSLPSPIELELKPGAQVLFVKNDKERRWVNGTLGIVTALETEDLDGDDAIYVRTEDGEEVRVERELWSNVRYTFNDKEQKIEEEELGRYVQFPIQLAWAITIHKSQGLTFQRVNIDLSGGAFSGGQTYVALSRCTSLEGISLARPIQRGDIFVRREVTTFARSFNDKMLIDGALRESRADAEYVAASHAFDNGDMDAAITHFIAAIHARYDIEKPLVKRFIRRKLNQFDKHRQEVARLKRERQEQEAFLHSLAAEYSLMGKECEKEGMESAAIANYEKALKLWPDAPEPKRRLERLNKRKNKRK